MNYLYYETILLYYIIIKFLNIKLFLKVFLNNAHKHKHKPY